jgi:hypothetical protein
LRGFRQRNDYVAGINDCGGNLDEIFRREKKWVQYGPKKLCLRERDARSVAGATQKYVLETDTVPNVLVNGAPLNTPCDL